MKTYTKKVELERPLLVISNDDNCNSPREDSNLGYFITVDRNYRSPDDENGEIYNIVKATGEVAVSQADHIKLMTYRIDDETSEKVVAIYPVTKYEHSGVSYSLGTQHGFDNSNNGFYIITKKTQKGVGVQKKNFTKVIKEELAQYNKYANGEVYSFVLYDKNGDVKESVGGFYDIEDIREYLPKSWAKEDLTKYISN